MSALEERRHRLLTVPEAAEELRLSRATLDRLIQHRKIKSVLMSNRRFIPGDAIDAYVETHTLPVVEVRRHG